MMRHMTIELGLDTFGDVTVDDSGDTISYAPVSYTHLTLPTNREV